jgi:hypothetical protein
MRRVQTNLRRHALTWVMACVVAACGADSSSATRLVLVTDTNIAGVVTVTYSVVAPGGKREQHTTGAVRPGHPAFVVMEKSASASLGPYQVHVEGLKAGGGFALSRDAAVSFVAGKTLAVPLHLLMSCIDLCEKTESCGPQGCVSKTAPAATVPWTGSPPTLPAGDGDGDGDADGGTGSDGGDGDGDGDTDGGTSCSNRSCVNGQEPVCNDQGEMIGMLACTASGPCTAGACVDKMGCVTQPANDDAPCGSGSNAELTCQDGVCGKGFACTQNCSPVCDDGVSDCELDCGLAANCNAQCPASAQCNVHCRNAASCDLNCAGNCTVACDTSTDCHPICLSGSTCEIICPAGAACDQTVCRDGAHCVLHCVDNQTCKFKMCQGNTPTDCGDGRIVCGRDC